MNLANIVHFLGGVAAAVLERTLILKHKGTMTLKSTKNNAINISVAPRNKQPRLTKYWCKKKKKAIRIANVSPKQQHTQQTSKAIFFFSSLRFWVFDTVYLFFFKFSGNADVSFFFNLPKCKPLALILPLCYRHWWTIIVVTKSLKLPEIFRTHIVGSSFFSMLDTYL